MQPSNEQRIASQGFKVRVVARISRGLETSEMQSVPRSELQIAVDNEFVCSNTAIEAEEVFRAKKAGPTGVRPAFVRDTAQEQ